MNERKQRSAFLFNKTIKSRCSLEIMRKRFTVARSLSLSYAFYHRLLMSWKFLSVYVHVSCSQNIKSFCLNCFNKQSFERQFSLLYLCNFFTLYIFYSFASLCLCVAMLVTGRKQKHKERKSPGAVGKLLH